MGEAEDAVLVEVIAAAGVPRDVLLRLRTELHHALRHRRAGESTAAQGAGVVGLRADKGIDVLRVVSRRAAQSGKACKADE